VDQVNITIVRIGPVLILAGALVVMILSPVHESQVAAGEELDRDAIRGALELPESPVAILAYFNQALSLVARDEMSSDAPSIPAGMASRPPSSEAGGSRSGSSKCRVVRRNATGTSRRPKRTPRGVRNVEHGGAEEIARCVVACLSREASND